MEEEKEEDECGGKKNGGGGGAKTGNKKRGNIDGSVLKEKEGDNYDDADSWDEHNFDVRGKEGADWGNYERDKVDDDGEESKEEEE